MPIQIYSAFHSDSNISPMCFRFEDTNMDVKFVKIKQILNYNEFYIGGIKFIRYLCNAQISNKETTLELIYNVFEHSWMMFEQNAAIEN